MLTPQHFKIAILTSGFLLMALLDIHLVLRERELRQQIELARQRHEECRLRIFQFKRQQIAARSAAAKARADEWDHE